MKGLLTESNPFANTKEPLPMQPEKLVQSCDRFPLFQELHAGNVTDVESFYEWENRSGRREPIHGLPQSAPANDVSNRPHSPLYIPHSTFEQVPTAVANPRCVRQTART
jgi:hypothetical protein